MILAIDPGPEKSAVVIWTGICADQPAIIENAALLSSLKIGWPVGVTLCAVEMIACYGMPVGAETFETCKFIGRIEECCSRINRPVRLVYRRQVKMHLCGTMKAKDGNIRQALIDKLGPVGTKKQPGPCYGISSHLWAALAVAITATETAP